MTLDTIIKKSISFISDKLGKLSLLVTIYNLVQNYKNYNNELSFINNKEIVLSTLGNLAIFLTISTGLISGKNQKKAGGVGEMEKSINLEPTKPLKKINDFDTTAKVMSKEVNDIKLNSQKQLEAFRKGWDLKELKTKNLTFSKKQIGSQLKKFKSKDKASKLVKLEKKCVNLDKEVTALQNKVEGLENDKIVLNELNEKIQEDFWVHVQNLNYISSWLAYIHDIKIINQLKLGTYLKTSEKAKLGEVTETYVKVTSLNLLFCLYKSFDQEYGRAKQNLQYDQSNSDYKSKVEYLQGIGQHVLNYEKTGVMYREILDSNKALNITDKIRTQGVKKNSMLIWKYFIPKKEREDYFKNFLKKFDKEARIHVQKDFEHIEYFLKEDYQTDCTYSIEDSIKVEKIFSEESNRFYKIYGTLREKQKTAPLVEYKKVFFDFMKSNL